MSQIFTCLSKMSFTVLNILGHVYIITIRWVIKIPINTPVIYCNVFSITHARKARNIFIIRHTFGFCNLKPSVKALCWFSNENCIDLSQRQIWEKYVFIDFYVELHQIWNLNNNSCYSCNNAIKGYVCMLSICLK